MLLEYVLKGTLAESLEVEEVGGAALQRYMELLEYLDKYGMGAAFCSMVCEPIKKILRGCKGYELGKMQSTAIQSDITTIYRIAPPNSPLRTLAAQGALSAHGTPKCETYFNPQIADVPSSLRICSSRS